MNVMKRLNNMMDSLIFDPGKMTIIYGDHKTGRSNLAELIKNWDGDKSKHVYDDFDMLIGDDSKIAKFREYLVETGFHGILVTSHPGALARNLADNLIHTTVIDDSFYATVEKNRYSVETMTCNITKL